MTEEWPPKLELDSGRILNLLTGDRFYSSADAALREVVLNAVDACGRGQLADGTSPHIQITFEDELSTVTIADNGIGMTRSAVGNLFATIGASAADLDSGDYQAVGEFGVGVVSYFLVCDRFELHTLAQGADVVALEFPRGMLDGCSHANEIAPQRSAIGTTIVFHVADQARYDLLIDRLPHWLRGVEGLDATREPGARPLAQGTSAAPATPVDVPLPDWLERASVGAPRGFDSWYGLDGRAHVDILYRGVFVQSHDVNGLWGMEGSLWVDPKRLRPRLNRESFASGELVNDVEPFLRECHPAVLDAGLTTLLETLNEDPPDRWSERRLVSLWLALPRDAAYAAVAAKWDEVFRNRPLFRVLEEDTQTRPTSLAELSAIDHEIYLAPDEPGQASDVVRASLRVLRATGKTVIQGVQRDQAYLSFATFQWQSDTDLLVAHFSAELPPIRRVDAALAVEILGATSGAIEIVLPGDPRVCLVRLGTESAPVVSARAELWLNADAPAGQEIVRALCDDNRGRLSLLVACYTHAPAQVAVLAQALGQVGSASEDRLGLLRREYLRTLVS
jgi:hypothetical protein